MKYLKGSEKGIVKGEELSAMKAHARAATMTEEEKEAFLDMVYTLGHSSSYEEQLLKDALKKPGLSEMALSRKLTKYGVTIEDVLAV